MSNRLRTILEDEGFTQAQLSRASQVSLTTINKLVNNQRKVSRTTQSKILKGLSKLLDRKIEREEIFPKEKPPTPPATPTF